MSGKFKALGLALLATFAMSAIAAQGAGAVVNHEFVSEKGATILTGVDVEGNHVFEATNRSVVCEHATFAGTQEGEVTDTVRVYPHYSGNCVLGPVEVHINTEGCAYTFGSDTTETAVEQTHAAVTIDCEVEHEITITGPGCTIHVPPQTVDGVSYDPEGEGNEADVKVTATVTGITYTVTEEGFCFLLGIVEGTHHDGEYRGKATVKGYEDEEVTGNTTEGLTGLTFHEGAQVGIGLVTP